MTEKSKKPNTISKLVVGENEDSMRLDSFLASRLELLSRVKIQRAVRKGGAKINGIAVKSSCKLNVGQVVQFEIPEVEPEGPVPENIPLEIIYEDDHLIGVNKPPQMVVHPARGHWSGTLTAALAFHFDQLSTCGGPTRPGIVHRLDRDTSGIIIVAKTDFAHSALSKQFEQRTVIKKYYAIVSPPPDRDRDHIDQPIGAHPYQREKMAIRRDHKTSRNASTFYEVIQRSGRFAQIIVAPKTGRTHQIRVHMAHSGSPVVADKLYSGQSQLKSTDIDGNRSDENILLERQALHAMSIQFQHPETGKAIQLEAPIATDLQSAWTAISDHSNRSNG